jgi:putative transposase
MARAFGFGKSVADDGWGMFRGMLRRKLERQGKRLVVIGGMFPSSRTCSRRGAVKDALGLSGRVFVCGSRGRGQDRDVNAALNIRREGLRMPGLPGEKDRRACGVSPDADPAGPRRLEREAPASDA